MAAFSAADYVECGGLTPFLAAKRLGRRGAPRSTCRDLNLRGR